MAPLGMNISPIDTGRYGSEEMRRIFSDESRYRLFIRVEVALVRALAKLGRLPESAAQAVSEFAEVMDLPLERIRQIEKDSHHEVMSVISAFAELCGPHGRFIHCGATSSDVIDTAIALQLKDARNILERKMCTLLATFLQLAETHKATLMIGRTHGQHAIPITFGFKVAGWADEWLRQLERLDQLTERLLVGKLSGAVGSSSAFGPSGSEVQQLVLSDLGLQVPTITTQVVSRDRIAEFVGWAALVASSLERVATEIRNLQRTEIAEVYEYFDEQSQVGSSTMPQKRNPVLAENICGLARIVRSLVIPALETVALWHERDLTNSSVERFTIPQAAILLDEMIHKTTKMIACLTILPEQMLANLRLSDDTIMSESVMMLLVQKGMDRRDAYTLLRRLARRAQTDVTTFRELVTSDASIRELVSPGGLELALDASRYIGECIPLTEAVVNRCTRFLENGGYSRRI